MNIHRRHYGGTESKFIEEATASNELEKAYIWTVGVWREAQILSTKLQKGVHPSYFNTVAPYLSADLVQLVKLTVAIWPYGSHIPWIYICLLLFSNKTAAYT